MESLQCCLRCQPASFTNLDLLPQLNLRPTLPTTHHCSANTMSTIQNGDADALIKSQDPKHPANLICSLCRQFYTFGWVTGTGGGVSIRHEDHIFLAPSGVEKELMQPDNIFVMDWASKEYIRRPLVGLVDLGRTFLSSSYYAARVAS